MMTPLSDLPPLLLPAPSHVERLAGWSDAPRTLTIDAGPHLAAIAPMLPASRPFVAASANDAWLRVSLDKGLARELKHPDGYRLTIDGVNRPPASIQAATHQGMRHAVATLMQLLNQFGSSLPAVRITDAPVFNVRGVMLDVSRDRVPTMQHLFEIVDQLAALKCNHLQLYTEHTFAYAGHEEVWQGWSALTPDEMRRLDEYCIARGITLAANQNCFGHLASWMKHPRYEPLAEITGDWQFYEWKRSGPFSLCPSDPGSIALVDDLLGQLLPNFSSKLVNINCDETADVGQGRSREDVARRGKAAVYFEFVEKVVECCTRRGFKPMFWADIALGLDRGGNAADIANIPRDLIAVAWDYEPTAPFRRWCELLKKSTRDGSEREVWLCPGSSSWRSFTGRTTERRGNIDRAIADGRATAGGGGASGILVGDWGDVGHRQTWPIALHGIVDALDGAWTGAVGGPDPLAESLQVWHDRELRLASWLNELGDADRSLRLIGGRADENGNPTPLKNATLIFNDLHLPLDAAPVGSAREWRIVEQRIRSLAAARPAVADALVNDELEHTLDQALTATQRGVARREHARLPADVATGLIESMRRVRAEHRRLWLTCSRIGGLDNSCSHEDRVISELESLL
ncbi:MAG: family 20 glycosylhydrolase [Planctomycetota bacterium]|nr:family 20 glycosylhydrolase [Planctomycetota bacterium]